MKILICDDDISTISVLKNHVDFSKYGIDEILEAYNGEMAINVISEHRPEIILCDIGMPKVDGIEVLQYIYNEKIETQFCFLTCYGDFEYAQKAIMYKAAGYITKPFKLEEVEQMIERMVASCPKKNNNDEKQATHDLLYTSVFKQVADGLYGTDIHLIQNLLDENGISFKADDCFRIVFTCLNITETVQSVWSKNLLLYASSRINDEIFNDYIGSAYTIVNDDDRFIWNITFTDCQKTDQQLKERTEKLNEFCKEHFYNEPVTLVSNVFHFYECADVVCCLYEIIRKIRFYSGHFFHQDDDFSQLVTGNIFNQEQLLWYLKNRDGNGYSEYIRNVINSVKDATALQGLRKEILMFFLTVLKDNDISDECIFSNEEINRLQNEKLTGSSFLQYCNVLLNIYQNEVNNLEESEKIILRVRKYLDDNYRANVGRDDLADIANVTPNYLSKLFKNNMGMNLREYINKLRIDESKRLLLSTNMSISDIALYVGYYNISYFSTIFHKLVGISPADWRNSGKEE